MDITLTLGLMFMICSMLCNTLHLRILKAVHVDITVFSHRKCPALWVLWSKIYFGRGSRRFAVVMLRFD